MAEQKKNENAENETIGLHSLKPADGSRKSRKRVGRGHGSGLGKTSGRGQKGYGSRSGAKDRARFEGGQMPIHMRMRKLRGPHMKKSMPFEPFRTHTQPVNLEDLEARFDAGAEVTPETLAAAGLATRKDVNVKILARGELSKKLTVTAHGFSAAARAAIEAAGGTVVFIDGEPEEKPKRARKAKPAAAEETAPAAETPVDEAPAAVEAPAGEAPADEPATEADAPAEDDAAADGSDAAESDA
jgi:large subunit ribosomal protein L15